MAKLSLFLTAVLALCWHILPAQQQNVTGLKKLEAQLTREHLASEAAVDQYLASSALPRTFVTPSGTRVLVTGVRADGTPEYRITLNAASAASTGAASLHVANNLGIQLEGEGITIAMWDAGLVKPHAEFGTRLASNEGPNPDDHATHVAGTLIAGGLNASAVGMAPKASAATYYFANDLAIVAGLASNQLISNHSYGAATGWFNAGAQWVWTGNPDISTSEDFRFGFYNARARTLDEIAYNAPYYSIFWAAGNDRSDVGDGTRPPDCNAGTGYDCLIPDAVAKNIFTIGGVNKVPVYNSSASVVMGNYSSWGPTDDGRIKPDLVAPGTDLFSTAATGTNAYTTMGGTSMATPSASGSLALLQELHKRLFAGRTMRAATLKALAIHTAREAGSFPGPDYVFGWGLVDVEQGARVLLSAGQSGTHIQELTLHNGETLNIPITAGPGKVTATIAWTDPPGTPVAEALDPTNLMLVNDLDMRISSTNGTVNMPWILDPLNPSRQAIRGDNFRDNVEKVEFNATSGQYNVSIMHKGDLVNNSQHFSLIISYQPEDNTHTYYWIGNSGNWNDGAHWSLTSGGPAANEVPRAADRVVIDDNSFSDPSAGISITENANVARLLWLSSKGSLDMQGNVLSVSANATFASKGINITNGTLEFDGEGSVSFQNGVDLPITVRVTSGKWSIHGSAELDELSIDGGEVHTTSTTLHVNRLNTNPTTSAKATLDNSTIVVKESTTIDGNKTAFEADNSRMILQGPDVQLMWNNVSWPGDLHVNDASTLSGENHLQRVVVRGDLTLEGTTTVGLLELKKDASVLLAPAIKLTLDSLAVESNNLHPVTITSSGSAELYIVNRNKYCFDYLNVTGVQLTGNAVVSVGTSSSITNASKWFAGTCEEALYAAVGLNYACEGALADLVDMTTPTPDSWEWTLRGPDQFSFQSTTQLPSVVVPESGTYTITLRVTLDGLEDVVTTSVEVTPNTLPEYSIAGNAGRLFSEQPGTAYRWFYDNNEIEGETQRSLPFDGSAGVYRVVTYQGACNRVSNPLTINGDVETLPVVMAYPNPASRYVYIDERSRYVGMINAVGARVNARVSGNGIDVSALPDGMYILQTQRDGIIQNERVIVRH